MRPLIDGDIIPYEIGSVAGFPGDINIKSWDFVVAGVDNLIDRICRAVEATAPPLIFLSGKENFRNDIAEAKGYKENRVGKPKPFHFNNIRLYLQFRYGASVSDGVEADDDMAIYATAAKDRGEEVVICSRDKDLRHVPTKHYSWECGEQPEIGPYDVDLLGEFWTDKLECASPVLKGTGYRFFAAQMLMGDATDNIPGVPNVGPKKAYKLLKDCDSVESLESVVYDTYWSYCQKQETKLEAFHCEFYESGAYDEGWAEPDWIDGKLHEQAFNMVMEQAKLLWMIRRRNPDGSYEMWRPGLYE